MTNFAVIMILDGKVLAQEVKDAIKIEVDALLASGKRAPHLSAILVGEDGASKTYVGSKERSCKEVGYGSTILRFPETISQDDLIKEVIKINNNPAIDGLIVQLPLPKHISEDLVIETINPLKDVDGFHTINTGKLTLGQDTFISATPYGIIQLIERSGIATAGKHCVVVGRSNIVGRPMSILMSLNKPWGNCTVTLCHSRTPDLSEFTKMADILIVALGKAEFVTGDMIKPGAIVIDVGITRVDDASNPKGYSIKGDVHFESAEKVAGWITPVPGGVGVMTIAGLLQNTLKAYKNNNL
jgi:methylenetetrahydrofolate dehydrogenase (NADP+)/methenyltetrahydrofolate cyclohydrolase